MKKIKTIVSKNAEVLASSLNLTPVDALEITIRSRLNDKIVEVVKKKGLTHAEVAKLAKTSRTRVTAIMNRNTIEVSTDLMLRILVALGIQARLQFKNAA